MKRKNLVIGAGIFYFVLVSANALAQKSNRLFLIDSQAIGQFQKATELAKWTDIGPSKPKSSEIGSRIVKDFNSRFANIMSTKWYTDGTGIAVYFSKDSFLNRVYYDLKGRWKCSITAYGEQDLPFDIKAAVKSVYYDWTISHVEEVQSPENNVYFVSIEDQTRVKQLKVNSIGDMEIYIEFNKV
jgi:hypothetical protein